VQNTLVELTDNIALSRHDYAAALAKRSHKLRSGGKSLEDVKEADAKWRASLEEFSKLYSAKAMAERPAHISEENWKQAITEQLISGSVQEFLLLEQEKVAAMESSKMGKFVEYMNKGGKLKRLIKGIGVGAIVGVATLPLGFVGGVVGAGGIVAGGAVGLGRFARSFAGWQGRKPTAKDNLTLDTASFQEAVKKGGTELSETDYQTLSPLDAIKKALNAGSDIEYRRDHEDRKALRKSVAVGAGAVALGALTTLGIHALDNKLGVSDWVKDHVFGKKPTTQIAGTKPSTPTTPAASNAPAVISTPIQPNVPIVVVDVLPTPNLPAGADFVSLDHLINAHGKFPWNRAVDFFNGDKTAGTNWIKAAAKKAGAVVHNAGTRNEWYEIDGHSDTNYVWSKLVDASLRP